MGILGESGSGKTTLLQTLAKQPQPALTSMGILIIHDFHVYGFGIAISFQRKDFFCVFEKDDTPPLPPDYVIIYRVLNRV